MTLKELLNDIWGIKKALLLTTATNGLTAKDRLLAVATFKVIPDNTDDKVNLLMQTTTGVDLQQSSQYHMISESDMQNYGISESAFRHSFEKLFEDNPVVFTYNTGFQHNFLGKVSEDINLKLYELPIIEKAIRNKYCFDEEELISIDRFYRACFENTTPTSINSVCRNLGMTKSPAPGELPLLRTLDVLRKLYSVALTEEVSLLPS